MTTSNALVADAQIPDVAGRGATELSAMDKQTREALSVFAHELRNPLAAIVTSLPLLERHPARDPGENLAREIIRRQILQLRRLVDALTETHGHTAVRAASTESEPASSSRRPSQQRISAADGAPPALEPDMRRRVLIVEDNADVQLMLKTLVELWGHQVWVASDGHSGLSAIERVRPDIALIDIDLPSVNGYEIARRLTAHPQRRRPYLVAVTGYSAPEQKERALSSGFDLHMAKPAEPNQLAELIRACPIRV